MPQRASPFRRRFRRWSKLYKARRFDPAVIDEIEDGIPVVDEEGEEGIYFKGLNHYYLVRINKKLISYYL